jgi:sulfur-carrier protein
MPTSVRIPQAFRPFTDGCAEITGNGCTVGDVLSDIERQYPRLRGQLLDERGVRRFLSVYLGDDDIRFREGLMTTVKPSDSITLLTLLAGG